MPFKAINPEARVNRGLRSFCAPRSWQPKTTLHIELRWSQVSSDSPVEGENTLSGEIVFTVCRKLITSNKLISRYCFRINCIFTEVTGSDGSSSSDKGGHTKWAIELCGLSVPLLYTRMHSIILNYLKLSFVVVLIAAKVFLSCGSHGEPLPYVRTAERVCAGVLLHHVKFLNENVSGQGQSEAKRGIFSYKICSCQSVPLPGPRFGFPWHISRKLNCKL